MEILWWTLKIIGAVLGVFVFGYLFGYGISSGVVNFLNNLKIDKNGKKEKKK